MKNAIITVSWLTWSPGAFHSNRSRCSRVRDYAVSFSEKKINFMIGKYANQEWTERTIGRILKLLWTNWLCFAHQTKKDQSYWSIIPVPPVTRITSEARKWDGEENVYVASSPVGSAVSPPCRGASSEFWSGVTLHPQCSQSLAHPPNLSG